MRVVGLAVLVALVVTGCKSDKGAPGALAPGTATTGWRPLDAPGVIDDVEVHCTLEIGSDDTLTLTCEFRNNGAQDQDFVWCGMTDLKVDRGRGDPNDRRDMADQLDNSLGIVRCDVTGWVDHATESSFHFGCARVEVAAGASEAVSMPVRVEPDRYVSHDGQTRMASDFQVVYSDLVALGPDRDASDFDAATCDDIVGQAKALSLEVMQPDSADWVTGRAPFDDPFVGFQPAGDRVPRVIHVPYAGLPCVPAALGLDNPPYPECEPDPSPPQPSVIDLHLFWWESHLGPPREGALPLLVGAPRLDGDATGIRVEAMLGGRNVLGSPQPVMVPFHEEVLAALRFCDAGVTDRCVVPDVEEGRSLAYHVPMRSVDTGVTFAQTGEIAKDTTPPVVDDHTAVRRDGAVDVVVTVTDAVTTPIHAEVWVSGDAGDTWDPTVLRPVVPLTESPATRTFRGMAPGLDDVDYFFRVQDAVDNSTFTEVRRTP